jgi:hypothetical protein
MVFFIIFRRRSLNLREHNIRTAVYEPVLGNGYRKNLHNIPWVPYPQNVHFLAPAIKQAFKWRRHVVLEALPLKNFKLTTLAHRYAGLARKCRVASEVTLSPCPGSGPPPRPILVWETADLSRRVFRKSID